MRHLQNEELVGLVFDELARMERDACAEHLEACPQCAAAVARLARAVVLLEKEPTQAPPPFAWSRLKTRIERCGIGHDWSEPAWVPLILGHAAGMILVLLIIVLTGWWLEAAPVWQSIRAWPLAAQIGPHGLTALIFFGTGALITLALTPVFWWESRRPRRG
jgi:anti-sigma factor RsiW